MQGDDPDKAARALAKDLCSGAEVCTLRDLARETELACMRATEEPSLDTPIEELSADLPERVKQLEALLHANRVVRQRTQESLCQQLKRLAA